MPRGAPSFASDLVADISFKVTTEDADRSTLIRVDSDAPCERRAGFAGPLGEHAALLDEVRLLGSHRARMAGAARSFGMIHSWRCLIQCPPEDAELLARGLRQLIEQSDPAVLRAYLSLPPVSPSDGKVWDGSPDPITWGPIRT